MSKLPEWILATKDCSWCDGHRDDFIQALEIAWEALTNIKNTLGPTPIPECCEGAKAEMEAAHNNAVCAMSKIEELGK